MLLQQTLNLPYSQLGTPASRRNASPSDLIRILTPNSCSPNDFKKSQFRNAPQNFPQQYQNKQIKLSLPSKTRHKPKRILKNDDPLITCSPIQEIKKPPINLFIKYLDGEISTQDLVSKTAIENQNANSLFNKKFQGNQAKKQKNAKLNVLQKFIQGKIQRKCTKEFKLTETTINVNQTAQQSKPVESFAHPSNSIKKLKQLQILFFQKEDIQKTQDPVFNYKQVFNIESDQLLSDINDERNRINQKQFNQIGKELKIKLQSKNSKKEPGYIPMEGDVIISKDVQLYRYLHGEKQFDNTLFEKKSPSEKVIFLKYKGTQRRIPTKKCLKYQKLPCNDPYQLEEPSSEESSLESDTQSYNISTLRSQEQRSFDQQVSSAYLKSKIRTKLFPFHSPSDNKIN